MKKSFLILTIFVFTSLNLSCSDQENDIKTEDNRDLSVFARKQFELSSQIVNLFQTEKFFDLNYFQNNISRISSESELYELYRKSNVKNIAEIISLTNQLAANSDYYLKNNPKLLSLNEAQKNDLIIKEFDLLFNNLQNGSPLLRRTCQQQYEIEQNRCMRNYAITTTAAIVSGFVSFGWGTVIGYAAGQAMLIGCLYDSEQNYNDCING